MKSNKVILAFLILTFLFFASSQMLIAGCSVANDGSSQITVYPNAPGTKLSGPLTVFYHRDSGELDYFVRLKKGVDLYIFSGHNTIVNDLDPNAWVSQAQMPITDWFEDTVVPYIYGCDDGVSPCPYDDIALKSYSLDVLSGNDMGNTDEDVVAIMDIVLAVD